MGHFQFLALRAKKGAKNMHVQIFLWVLLSSLDKYLWVEMGGHRRRLRLVL